MRIIQQPITKLSSGEECAQCNFILNVTSNTGEEYIISISADNNLGSGNEGRGKHDCYRTQLALFVQGTKDMDEETANQYEEHCNIIMQRELLYYLKNELKNDQEKLGKAK